MEQECPRGWNSGQMVKNVALLLGGGGSAGHAWMIGVIAGLAEAGIDMTEAADLVIGRSSRATDQKLCWMRRRAAARLRGL